MNVEAVIRELRAAIGSNWRDVPWDGLQAGALSASVTGIAVAWSPELDILKQAVAQECNLIVCKDPIYWFENEGQLQGDSSSSRIIEGTAGTTPWAAIEQSPLYRAKRDFIAGNQLTIYRISQNWDGGSRRMAAQGLLRTLGWKEVDSLIADEHYPETKTSIVRVAPRSLIETAAYVKMKMVARSARVLGDRAALIRQIAVHPGYLTIAAATKIGQVHNLDLIVTGEACEWEAFVYAEDWISAGRGKGLIMAGLANTSDTAAYEFASWLDQLLPKANVNFLPVGDPFIPVYAGDIR